MTDRCTCHAAHAVNEVLIKLMGERVKVECSKMYEAGASVEDINAALVDIIAFWEDWRRQTLEQVMREVEGMTATLDDLSPPTSLRRN